jgi:hypothetical protein
VVRTGFYIRTEEVGRDRSKLRNKEFDNLNLRKDGEFTEDEIEGGVTEMEAKRN